MSFEQILAILAAFPMLLSFLILLFYIPYYLVSRWTCPHCKTKMEEYVPPKEQVKDFMSNACLVASYFLTGHAVRPYGGEHFIVCRTCGYWISKNFNSKLIKGLLYGNLTLWIVLIVVYYLVTSISYLYRYYLA